jgi:maleate isomerase
VTIRLDTPGEVYPVAAEALAPGVRSIRGATEIDLRKAETFRFLDRERQTLAQHDCLRDEPAVPPELIELYGVRAQILVPVVLDERLAGIVSVHHAATVRDWTEAEVAAAEAAAAQVRELLV